MTFRASSASPTPPDVRRVLIRDVSPQVDGGRAAVKRIVGDSIEVQCVLIADGHDALAGSLLYRKQGDPDWKTENLISNGQDRYSARFVPDALGTWEFTIEAWIDSFATWRAGLAKKVAANQNVHAELLVGSGLLRAAAKRAADGPAHGSRDAAALVEAADTAARPLPLDARVAACAASDVVDAATRHPDRTRSTRFEHTVRVTVDPERARFSAWYEMFPRSSGPAGTHGTLRDCIARLPYVASMGFDILYLPPIHPIGNAFRKGPNNALEARRGDVGSPWAIGNRDGGHTAVHPELGTLDDVRHLVREAKALGMDVALDIAFQASPDHPFVREHPQWFRHRPDGTIQYAENPPKKYQDIYPFDFECDDWQNLWRELLGIILFWCEQGIRVFRADNPHTKSIRFWEWCIAEIKQRYPEAIFLAEAFTRPTLMYALAMAGFTQSYTYFTWRTTASEFKQYMTELSKPPVSDYFRPNFWPNTPDILPEHLQFGGRAAFVQRLVLAATLSSNYGIYGPPFELMEHVARAASEEYADNEKYQIRAWNLDRDDSLRDVIAAVNAIRRAHRPLQGNAITFHACDDDTLLCFSKKSADATEVVLVVVGMDVHHRHGGTLTLDLEALGLSADETFQAHDLLSDTRVDWRGTRCYVEIDPSVMPASIFRLRRRVRTEHDFEYFS